MKIKKCQKCGSENIILVKINPDYYEDEQIDYVECKDFGFSIEKKSQREIDFNWEEKDKN